MKDIKSLINLESKISSNYSRSEASSLGESSVDKIIFENSSPRQEGKKIYSIFEDNEEEEVFESVTNVTLEPEPNYTPRKRASTVSSDLTKEDRAWLEYMKSRSSLTGADTGTKIKQKIDDLEIKTSVLKPRTSPRTHYKLKKELDKHSNEKSKSGIYSDTSKYKKSGIKANIKKFKSLTKSSSEKYDTQESKKLLESLDINSVYDYKGKVNLSPMGEKGSNGELLKNFGSSSNLQVGETTHFSTSDAQLKRPISKVVLSPLLQYSKEPTETYIKEPTREVTNIDFMGESLSIDTEHC